MTRRRFYAPPEAFLPDGEQLTLSEDESRHLRDVLRLRAGDEAFVFDGEGREFACVVGDMSGRKGVVTLEVRGRAEPPSAESPLELTLAVALLKGEKFDLVVQKAVELGASSIAPVITKRADMRLRDARDTERRIERWRRLALEGAKQSGRARVPFVAMPVALDSFIEGAWSAKELRLFFAERGGRGLASLAVEEGTRPAIVKAVVGPEGGWEDEEIALAASHGWTIITLGGRTLRAETAAIAVCTLLQNIFGDLG